MRNFPLLPLMFLAGLTACSSGGGDSQSPAPINEEEQPVEQPVEQNDFSMVFRHSLPCGSKVLPALDVLVYDETPVTPTTTFTQYSTDEKGAIALEETSDTVSLSVILDSRFGPKVYTFTELKKGNYDVNVLFEGESDLALKDLCEFKQSELIATVMAGQIEPFTRVDLKWGRGLGQRQLDFAGQTINVTDLELFGSTHERSPLFMSVAGMDGNEYYGFKTAEFAEDNAVSLDIIHTATNIDKPDRNAPYEVSSMRLFDDALYTLNYNSASAEQYPTYPAFDLGVNYFELRKRLTSEIDPGDDQVITSIAMLSVNNYSDTASFEQFAPFPVGEKFDIVIDQDARTITATSDVAELNPNQAFVYQRYVLEERALRWYVYSPGNSTIILPALTDELETLMDDATLDRASFSLRELEGAADFTESLETTRFNDLDKPENDFWKGSPGITITSYYSAPRD